MFETKQSSFGERNDHNEASQSYSFYS